MNKFLSNVPPFTRPLTILTIFIWLLYCINFLVFSDDLVNPETGLYHKGTQTNRHELINGAMKILSGFSWINKEIHYPEKLIDFCLDTEFKNEGCDLVDIVYVLYRCHEESDYRRKDIVDYLNNLW